MRRNPFSFNRQSLPTTTPNRNPLLSFHSKNKIPSPPHESHDPPFSRITKIIPPKPELPPKTLISNKAKTFPPFHSDLPFDFRFSYSETDGSARPLGFREPPRFSPFGPGRLDRKWDGVCAPLVGEVLSDEALEERRRSVLGEGLGEEEVEELVERFRHSDCSRQINLGFA